MQQAAVLEERVNRDSLRSAMQMIWRHESAAEQQQRRRRTRQYRGRLCAAADVPSHPRQWAGLSHSRKRDALGHVCGAPPRTPEHVVTSGQTRERPLYPPVQVCGLYEGARTRPWEDAEMLVSRGTLPHYPHSKDRVNGADSAASVYPPRSEAVATLECAKCEFSTSVRSRRR